MTGKQLFVIIAGSCAIGRARAGKLSKEKLTAFLKLAETGEEPGEDFLNECVPGMIKRLEKHAEDRMLEKWSYGNVRRFQALLIAEARK